MITLTSEGIPAAMRQLRQEQGLTQAGLARMLSMSSQGLYYWEHKSPNGERIPNIIRLTEWANALGYELTITLTPKGQG